MRGRSARRLVAVSIAVVALSCCGASGGEPSVRVGEIAGAVQAVETSLGGPQRFSEVNATQAEVNVFVTRDGMDFAYVVHRGKVDAPTSGEPYTGPTFGATDIAFEPGVLDHVAEQLPDSDVVAFSVTPHEGGGGVDYIATVRGKAAELRVLLDATGKVISVG